MVFLFYVLFKRALALAKDVIFVRDLYNTLIVLRPCTTIRPS